MIQYKLEKLLKVEQTPYFKDLNILAVLAKSEQGFM